eukprot:TRINITY_DN36938_c0_g1_i1.p1 TRINITY_DN36938_c0_g1~~TRINITY_DN36938_c0_g1_i1.p1  ORF type:complete len:484 (-),score=61.94 TRINITY_DN36938_c0_g1_i1:113-1480(-)
MDHRHMGDKRALHCQRSLDTDIRKVDEALESLQRQVDALKNRRALLLAGKPGTSRSRNTCPEVDAIAALPDDTQEQIFVQLHAREVGWAAATTCRAWKQAVRRQSLWCRLFRRDLYSEYGPLLRLIANQHVIVRSWWDLYADAEAMGSRSTAADTTAETVVGTDGAQTDIFAVGVAVGPDFGVGVAVGPDDDEEAPTTVGVGGDADFAEPTMASIAIGVDRVPTTVHVGGDSDFAEPSMASIATGLDHIPATVAVGNDTDLAVLRTASTASGLERADMASGLIEAITFSTASTATGIERSDMATGPDMMQMHSYVESGTDSAELFTVSRTMGALSATVGVRSDAGTAVIVTASKAAGIEQADVGCAASSLYDTTSRAAGTDRADIAIGSSGLAGVAVLTTVSTAVGPETVDMAAGTTGGYPVAATSLMSYCIDVGTNTASLCNTSLRNGLASMES